MNTNIKKNILLLIIILTASTVGIIAYIGTNFFAYNKQNKAIKIIQKDMRTIFSETKIPSKECPECIDKYFAELKSKDWRIRRNAIYKIINVKPDRAKKPLKKALTDKNSSVRAVAAFALGSFKDKTAIDSLYKLAKTDKSENVRTSAVSALGKINTPNTINKLHSLLNSPKKDVQENTLYVLGQLKIHLH